MITIVNGDMAAWQVRGGVYFIRTPSHPTVAPGIFNLQRGTYNGSNPAYDVIYMHHTYILT